MAPLASAHQPANILSDPLQSLVRVDYCTNTVWTCLVVSSKIPQSQVTQCLSVFPKRINQRNLSIPGKHHHRTMSSSCRVQAGVACHVASTPPNPCQSRPRRPITVQKGPGLTDTDLQERLKTTDRAPLCRGLVKRHRLAVRPSNQGSCWHLSQPLRIARSSIALTFNMTTVLPVNEDGIER